MAEDSNTCFLSLRDPLVTSAARKQLTQKLTVVIQSVLVWGASSVAPVSATAMERRSETLYWIQWVLKRGNCINVWSCMYWVSLTDFCLIGRSGSARHAEGSVTAASVVPEKVAVPQGCWSTWLNIMALITYMPIWKGDWSIYKSEQCRLQNIFNCLSLTPKFISSLQPEEGVGGQQPVKCGGWSWSWTWLTYAVNIRTVQLLFSVSSIITKCLFFLLVKFLTLFLNTFWTLTDIWRR